MKKCIKCGADIKDTAKFCDECGTEQTNELVEQSNFNMDNENEKSEYASINEIANEVNEIVNTTANKHKIAIIISIIAIAIVLLVVIINANKKPNDMIPKAPENNTTTIHKLSDDEQHLENAKKYVESNDFENAKSELNAVTTDFKNNFEYNIVCTDYYLAKGDSGSAVDKIATFVNNHSDDENIDKAKKKLQEVKVIAKQNYENDMNQYATTCEDISYTQLAKQPNDMFGKLVKIECEVSQVVVEDDYSTFLLAEMTKDEYGNYNDSIAFSYYWHYDNEPRIIKGDKIVIYGQAANLYDYETVLGSTNTVPLIIVYYIDDYSTTTITTTSAITTTTQTTTKKDNTNTVVYKDKTVKITYKGTDEDDIFGTELNFTIENLSKKNITVQASDVSINGIMVDPIFSCTVSAGKIANDDMSFLNLEDDGIDKIKTVELSFNVFDDDSLDTIVDTKVVKIRVS